MNQKEREAIIQNLNMVGCVLSLKEFSDEKLKEQREHYKQWADSVGSFTRYTGLEEMGEFVHIDKADEPAKFS